MNKEVIIIGGEGNGGVVASCIEDNRKRFNDLEWKVAGFLNDFEKGNTINGYPVLGGTDDIGKFMEQDYYFVFAILMIGRGVKSEEVFLRMNIPDHRLATIIHKSAFVADCAIIEPGVFIMSNCYVGPGARIGKCCLLMSNVTIGHHTKAGPLCHFSLGSITGSYVVIEKAAYIGLGAIIVEKKQIGKYSMAGANCLVTRDIPDNEIHIGTPSRFFKTPRVD